MRGGIATYLKRFKTFERPHHTVTFRLQLTTLYGLGQVNSSFRGDAFVDGGC